jgi:hypothetical protein
MSGLLVKSRGRAAQAFDASSYYMTKMFCRIVICFLLVISERAVTAKEWRGIVPLKSTRVDVERLLGAPTKSSQSSLYYNLSREIVVIEFQTEVCDSSVGKFGLGWNVRYGTVVGVGVIPKGTPRKEEYLLSSNFNIEDENALIYYSDDVSGMSIENL